MPPRPRRETNGSSHCLACSAKLATRGLEFLRHRRYDDFALVNRAEVERALPGAKHFHHFGRDKVMQVVAQVPKRVCSPEKWRHKIRFGLRSASGGKWSGGRRGASSGTKPECNAPPPNRRRKPAALAAICQYPLVTSAFFAKRDRRGRRGKGATGKPVQRSENCVGQGGPVSEYPAQVAAHRLGWRINRNRHKNCLVFVTMNGRFVDQCKMDSNAGFGLRFGKRQARGRAADGSPPALATFANARS